MTAAEQREVPPFLRQQARRERIVQAVHGALTRAADAPSAADLVREACSPFVVFGEGCMLWLTLLCQKWHDKTPDEREQAEQITDAILRNVRRS